MSIEVAGEIGIRALFWAALGFVAVVSVFWPWWRSQLGWSIIAKSLALALAVFPVMLSYWFGPGTLLRHPWIGWVSVAGLWLVPPILGWRALVIWQAQRKARDII